MEHTMGSHSDDFDDTRPCNCEEQLAPMSGGPRGPLTAEMILSCICKCGTTQHLADNLNTALAPLIATERAAGMVEMKVAILTCIGQHWTEHIQLQPLSRLVHNVPISGESALRELVERAIQETSEYHLALRLNKPTPDSVIAEFTQRAAKGGT